MLCTWIVLSSAWVLKLSQVLSKFLFMHSVYCWYKWRQNVPKIRPNETTVTGSDQSLAPGNQNSVCSQRNQLNSPHLCWLFILTLKHVQLYCSNTTCHRLHPCFSTPVNIKGMLWENVSVCSVYLLKGAAVVAVSWGAAAGLSLLTSSCIWTLISTNQDQKSPTDQCPALHLQEGSHKDWLK